jgi:2-methylaconitate isomerase
MLTADCTAEGLVIKSLILYLISHWDAMDLRRIPAVIMRGGTSRGLFLRAADVPDDPAARDALLLDLMGSPHPLQVDGLGGGHSSTSKVMIISPSAEPGIDVDYLFAQVSVRTAYVDYTGNCGNLTAAVAHFAVEEGLVDPQSPVTEVHLRNRNTGVSVVASVLVEDGTPLVHGTCEIAGVDRPGAPITTTYLDPAGAVFDSALPTGRARDDIDVPRLGVVSLSIVDVTNPMIFVRATDLGLTGEEDPAVVNGQDDVLARVEAVRACCAVTLGLVPTMAEATAISPSQPKIAVLAPPRGDLDDRGDHASDLTARAFSMQRMHHAFTVTGLLCLAAASAIPGTIPHEVAGRPGAGPTTTTVAHASGVTTVCADVEDGTARVRSVSIDRTARRLMQGDAFVPA